MDNENIRKKSKKIKRLVRNNDVSKATNYMLSNGVCRMNESIKKQLLDKHPEEKEYEINPNQQYAPQIKFTIKHLETALNKIKATKSAGQDGWKPIYWKCIRESIYDTRVKNKLLKLINFCISGRFDLDYWKTCMKHCPEILKFYNFVYGKYSDGIFYG